MGTIIRQIATPGGTILNATPDQARAAGVSETDIAAALTALRKEDIKIECKRRIYAVASSETQMNMASMATVIGAKTPSARTEQEKGALAAFEASLAWVQAMRENISKIVADAKLDPLADASWPACPKEVLALVSSF